MALVNAGLTEMVKGLIADSPSTFTNGNSAIALGSGSTAVAAGDTTLGTELGRKAMEATFPSRAGLVVTFKSVFGTGDGNGTVAEWGILNNTTSGGVLLSRKVESLGTKNSAQSWTVTATLTFSVGA